VQGRVPRRLFAMLLVYPLMSTAVAVDLVWALFYRGWWQPVVYTAGVAVIATALAGCAHVVRELPPAAPIGTLVVSFTIANTVMVVAAGEVVRSGRSPYDVAVVGMLFSVVTVVMTAVICRLAEIPVVRRRGVRRDPVGPIVTRPLPTLVDLIGPTLVQPLESTRVLDRGVEATRDLGRGTGFGPAGGVRDGIENENDVSVVEGLEFLAEGDRVLDTVGQ
jgi:hypothetical protein